MKPPLNLSRILKKVHKIFGKLLYYVRAIDCTILTELNTIQEQQSKPTEFTAEVITKLLDYSVTSPNDVVRHKTSDMVLHVKIYDV